MSDANRTIISISNQNNFKGSKLYEKILSEYLICGNDLKRLKEDMNINKIKEDTIAILEQLKPEDPVQMMLAAQMLSIHTMQQDMITFANNSVIPNQKQYYTNTVIKLSNLFVSQANLFSKLKSDSEAVNVNDVHIHDGGQAVVGTINCYGGTDGPEN